jgi:general secretion pathway protein A
MYTSFFGFKEEPFRQTPDPRFLHLAEPHRQALITLVQGIVQRKGFLAVTGAVGTGKTTLLHTLLMVFSRKLIANHRLASAFIVNPTLSRDELLEYVLQEFEISCLHATKPSRLLALHQFLLDTHSRGATTVLVIDEAHLVPVEVLEEIRLLSNADSYSEKLLQVILCGQPELRQTLVRTEMRALNQRIAVQTDLRPLNISETHAYICERLHVAGMHGPSPFREESIQPIYQYSAGIPRLSNMLCDSCLSLGFRSQNKALGCEVVFEAAALLGLGQSSQLCANDELRSIANNVTA